MNKEKSNQKGLDLLSIFKGKFTKKTDSSGKESSSEENVAPQKDGKSRIYNIIIVDESGSMSGLERVTLSGINETISTIREAQKTYAGTQEHYLTLVTFDSGSKKEDVRIIIDAEPIENVRDFSDYHPNGCTPLYDAMGISLIKLRERIKDDEDATGVVTVLTDGMENSSRKWSSTELRKLIEQLKEEGWTFSYMGSAHNVKEVTDLLSIDNVMEFSHDVVGTDSSWRYERSSRMKFYAGMDCFQKDSYQMSREEKMMKRRKLAKDLYKGRVTPDNIIELQPNEIFVFGSNIEGAHCGGAARFALKNFGAVMGQGEGLQGHSYAIPTMEGLVSLRDAVMRFIEFARKNPQLHFLVTRIGCGIAGYSVHDIAPMFKEAVALENVSLPEDFWGVLGLKLFES